MTQVTPYAQPHPRPPAPAGVRFAPFAVQPTDRRARRDDGSPDGPRGGPVADFFAQIGKLLLMFFAGSEIDLSQFRRTGTRSLAFGFLTFSIPLAVGTVVTILAGYTWLTALLVGSLMASHTLLGFPLVQGMKLSEARFSPILRHF